MLFWNLKKNEKYVFSNTGRDIEQIVPYYYTVSQLKWCQNLNPFKYDITQCKDVPSDYIYYYLFNVKYNSFVKIYNLVSEIWKFKNHRFVS